MGMDFDDLETFGKLRKINKLGPVGMFRRLLPMWQGHLSTKEIANKVKTFFKFYAINRHKNIVLTPSIHVEVYYFSIFKSFLIYLNIHYKLESFQ